MEPGAKQSANRRKLTICLQLVIKTRDYFLSFSLSIITTSKLTFLFAFISICHITPKSKVLQCSLNTVECETFIWPNVYSSNCLMYRSISVGYTILLYKIYNQNFVKTISSLNLFFQKGETSLNKWNSDPNLSPKYLLSLRLSFGNCCNHLPWPQE